MAALSSFIVTRNDRYAHDCRDRAAVTRWRRPWIRVPQWNNVALWDFCGGKVWQQRISTKKCCPRTVNIACHIKQSIIWCRNSRKGEQLMKTNNQSVGRWKSSVCVAQTATTRILCRRFPGTCERVGEVFKFIWRLLWKINVVCMSLSPFVFFQSRYVTYFWFSLVKYAKIISQIKAELRTHKNQMDGTAIFFENNMMNNWWFKTDIVWNVSVPGVAATWGNHPPMKFCCRLATCKLRDAPEKRKNLNHHNCDAPILKQTPPDFQTLCYLSERLINWKIFVATIPLEKIFRPLFSSLGIVRVIQ